MKRIRLYLSDNFSMEADVDDGFLDRLDEFEEIGIIHEGEDGFKVRAKRWEIIE